jgi:hypothetical protein
MLNSLTERNLDMWKTFQQGLLNSVPAAPAPGAKPKTPPKSGTR